MDFRRYVRLSVLIILAIFTATAFLSTSVYGRLDMSRGKAFSISSYTAQMLSRLEERITISYYVSARLTARVPAVEEIIDLLYEYQRLGNGLIDLEIIDPDSAESPAPEDLGIQPQELQVVENNEQTFARVYSGIAVSYLDGLEVIPIIVDAADLEYELSSRIQSLTLGGRPRIGLMLGKVNEDPSQYQTVLQYLSQYYDIRLIPAGDQIPPDIEVLLVMGSAVLEDRDLFLIEQYMLSGNGVLFAADVAEVNIEDNLLSTDYSGRPAGGFLAHHGFSLEPAWVIDESNLLLPVQQQQGRVVVNSMQPYPQWPAILPANVEPGHPLTAGFEGLDLFWAGPVFPSEEAIANGARILAKSSEVSALDYDFLTQPDTGSIASRPDSRGNYPLVIAYSGPLRAYYREAPSELTNVDFDSPLGESGESRLIIMGDSDFPGELFQTAASTHNIFFMQSIIEYLSGDRELLELRTRGQRNTGLNALATAQERNRVIAFAEILSFFLLPSVLASFGILRYLRRRAKSRRLYPYEGDVEAVGPAGNPQSDDSFPGGLPSNLHKGGDSYGVDPEGEND